ncbi:MAG TPA: glycoside hydrolase family 38 C-terminal domain-containing protein [Planctomycetota bacterium]|nr:glycoside hydrolase family 38 C-terminal domain-containing protein [Planctomycetota bacterium]
MPARRLHLICNAHLDPIWLWEWEEGAAEALSTFRTAADLCEEFPGFVFNHNEVILYKWVEEYEPALFRRIRRLVRRGQWNIMGGWWVQPDCNMPFGESFVRQALLGKRYFREKFGVDVRTAINVDPFGHTRGLVQILAKSGYDSYLFMRPDQSWCKLEADDFVWVGYDGSEVLAHRINWYGSHLGRARKMVESQLQRKAAARLACQCWGVGNHGGGPSRKDIRDLDRLAAERRGEVEIVHSTPQAYFRELARRRAKLPRHAAGLNPYDQGCYTSQVRIKQKHRLLENEIYAAEKMCSAAALQGLMVYPGAELRPALEDLLFTEFHDVLPGSSIQPAEEAALRTMDHGLELVSRAKARAFFALASGQPRAAAGTIPVFVYNPHPRRARAVVECEFQLPDQNWDDSWTDIEVFAGGRRLASQVEKEASSIPLDWRKRVVFAAELEPGQMNRFDCRLKLLPGKPAPRAASGRRGFRFRTRDLEVVINTRTGLVDRFRVAGRDLVRPGAFQPLVIADNFDPWGMTVRSFRKVAGRFRLASAAEGARRCGLPRPVPSVRVVEDGAVRTVVEAVFVWGQSMVVQRYKLPKSGAEMELEVRVQWAEKDKCLKLSVPTNLGAGAEFLGQVACGVERLPANGDEAVAQKWLAVAEPARGGGMALSVANDGTYGSDFAAGELRLTLLRSPAYSAHPIKDRPVLPADRFMPRQEQGERLFRFWISGGRRSERLSAVGDEAMAHNEKPMALSFFPSGAGRRPKPFVSVDGAGVELMAAKPVEDGRGLVVRLFEATGRASTARVRLPFAGMGRRVYFRPFEIKTLRVDPRRRTWTEADLLEKPVR